MIFKVLFERLNTGERFWETRETDFPEYFESEMHENAVNLDLKLIKIVRKED